MSEESEGERYYLGLNERSARTLGVSIIAISALAIFSIPFMEVSHKVASVLFTASLILQITAYKVMVSAAHRGYNAQCGDEEGNMRACRMCNTTAGVLYDISYIAFIVAICFFNL